MPTFPSNPALEAAMKWPRSAPDQTGLPSFRRSTAGVEVFGAHNSGDLSGQFRKLME
jgi:hypothetical protein